MEQTGANTIVDRMIRAAKLENALYDEVERDKNATGQALTVVVIVALASGIGSALAGIIGRAGIGAAIGGFIVGIIMALIGWAIWSFVTYWVGTSLFGGTATYGELLRAVGFAYTPNVLGILSFIPGVGPLIAFVGSIWALVAGVVAVRQALDFDTGKAIITAIIGWIILMIVVVVIGGMFAAIIGLGSAVVR
ncbi:MAG: YIP1 family protein [Chloroflexi bacterium]|nr:YIP1 family protein [Chloroflexota bacterium]